LSRRIKAAADIYIRIILIISMATDPQGAGDHRLRAADLCSKLYQNNCVYLQSYNMYRLYSFVYSFLKPSPTLGILYHWL